MVYMKLHNTPNGNILAMCDEHLLGKILKEGAVTIDLKKYDDFYKGEVATDTSLKYIKPAEIFSANIVGDESVKLAVSLSIIKKDHIRKVDGVPYAHAYKL
jgi:uncharacterized protein